jgi:hypothetical protein
VQHAVVLFEIGSPGFKDQNFDSSGEKPKVENLSRFLLRQTLTSNEGAARLVALLNI